MVPHGQMGNLSNSLSSILVLCLLLMWPTATLRGNHFVQVTAQVAEPTLRKLAIKVVMPTYPSKAVKRKRQGRVVIQVLLDEQGVVNTIKPVEAPDDDFFEAVKRAVKQWKFSAATLRDNRRPARIDGKLTFYFRFQKGSPVVSNPGDKQ
jgi:TonB family protein